MASLKQQRTQIRLQNLFLKNNSRATSVDIHRQCEGDVTVRFVASEPRGKRHDVCHTVLVLSLVATTLQGSF